MNPLTRFCRWWLGIKEDWPWPQAAVPSNDADELFRIGVQQGVAIGELRGRAAAIGELELMLLNKHARDVEAEDVALVKTRTFH